MSSTAILIIVACFLLYFTVFRFINLWYWKIDEKMSLLKNQIENSTKQNKLLEEQNALLKVYIMASTDNKIFALNHKISGEVKMVTALELANYSLLEYSVSVLEKK